MMIWWMALISPNVELNLKHACIDDVKMPIRAYFKGNLYNMWTMAKTVYERASDARITYGRTTKLVTD